MPGMLYADQPTVLRDLSIDPADQVAIDEAVTLENGIADVLDGMTGTSFGMTPTPETREVTLLAPTPRLIASVGIRSLDQIEIGGTWDGAAWVGAPVVDAADYRLVLRDQHGLCWGIDAISRRWVGTVRVTATWADQPRVGVPADVQAAITFLTVRQYRRQHSSPTEQVGPDGLLIPTPHGWDDPLVKGVIARHRITRVIV